jgi:hypothetical protein
MFQFKTRKILHISEKCWDILNIYYIGNHYNTGSGINSYISLLLVIVMMISHIGNSKSSTLELNILCPLVSTPI